MRIAILGTGMVGRTLAIRLTAVGHDVVIGTRNVAATIERLDAADQPDAAFADWRTARGGAGIATFADAATQSELVINATSGGVSLDALAAAGDEHIAGKVLLDVSNPLDFSNGFPPSLSVVNTDSLAEQIQRAHPTTRVVKSLNTMNCDVMVDPARIPGKHVVFVAGEDAAAKSDVSQVLSSLGWPTERIVDLGGIQAARGTEMYLPLWLSLMQSLGSADFNITIARP